MRLFRQSQLLLHVQTMLMNYGWICVLSSNRAVDYATSWPVVTCKLIWTFDCTRYHNLVLLHSERVPTQQIFHCHLDCSTRSTFNFIDEDFRNRIPLEIHQSVRFQWVDWALIIYKLPKYIYLTGKQKSFKQMKLQDRWALE